MASKEGRLKQGLRGHLLYGLSDQQRVKVAAALEAIRLSEYGRDKKGGYNYPGWSLYRVPSTLNPPIVVRLIKRTPGGKIEQVISIAER